MGSTPVHADHRTAQTFAAIQALFERRDAAGMTALAEELGLSRQAADQRALWQRNRSPIFCVHRLLAILTSTSYGFPVSARWLLNTGADDSRHRAKVRLASYHTCIGLIRISLT